MANKGKIAIIEWKKIKSDIGPVIDHRLEPDLLADKLKLSGFNNIALAYLNEYFYTITGFK